MISLLHAYEMPRLAGVILLSGAKLLFDGHTDDRVATYDGRLAAAFFLHCCSSSQMQVDLQNVAPLPASMVSRSVWNTVRRKLRLISGLITGDSEAKMG